MFESPVLIFAAFIGVMILFSVISRLLNPPKPVPMAEIPSNVLHEYSRYEGFRPHREEAIFEKNSGKYRFKGQFPEGREMKIEIEMDKAGQIEEVEIDLPVSLKKPLVRQSEVAIDQLPQPVLNRLNQLVGVDEFATLVTTRVSSATFGEDPAYEVRGRSQNWDWEITLLASGELVELEKEKR